MAILDTDIIVAFLKNDKDAVNKIKKFVDLGISLETTTINSFELFTGAFRLQKSNQNALESALSFLSNTDVLPFDVVASRIAGNIANKLKQKGIILDQADIMIAAIAIKEGKVLVSRNTKHFQRIEELKLDVW